MKCFEVLSAMKARVRLWLFLPMIIFLSAGTNLLAAEEDPSVPSSPVSAPRMDYGSMLTYTVGLPVSPGKTNENLALKGICVRLGGSNEAAVCFDTDLLRYYAGWTGGFLDISKTHLT